MGRSLEVGRKSENLPAIALLLCSRDLERVCDSIALFLSAMVLFWAGRLRAAVSFVGTAVFLLEPSR